MSHIQLETVLQQKKMVVCIGAGGVGKTTFAATIALRAAMLGRKVACLTIDPAKRLGDVLGIHQITGDNEMSVERPAFDGTELHDLSAFLRADCRGSLHVGMLNAKQTFDNVVRDKSSSPARAEKILKNKLYRYVSGSLSGMQEYMALERLCQLQENDAYDFVVLDTPPSDNVIDFFSAPSRMRNALDGPLVRMMRKVYGSGSSPGFDFFGRWAMSVFGVLSKITGASLLDEIMEFVDALSDLFGNFSVRAVQIEQMLSGKDVDVFMVTRPDDASAKETGELQKALETRGFHVDGLVFNQCTLPKVVEAIPESLIEPCRSEFAEVNRTWNIVYEQEQGVISKVVNELSTFSLVCTIPLIPVENNRIDGLIEIWNAIQEVIRTDEPVSPVSG
ncbi:MAG: ArsA family ATPase [Deltaproteobacteria bacterium]|nr:ArsA family ATPase [Deltaproteobacteria bacterium]MBN2673217.1 ArsA family ATPase [Deltaproteobacteria bacterium]